MPIVIAGGKSVSDYPRNELEHLCKYSFTFAVNESAFRWPCDIIVMMDFLNITNNVKRLQEMGKPIVTREWVNFEQFKLDLIFLPQKTIEQYPSSGMVACKLSDAMARQVEKKSYVFGIDATAGHYYDDIPADTKEVRHGNSMVDLKLYEALGLTNTVNMGIHSRVTYWPKQSNLPPLRKTLIHTPYRVLGVAWVKTYAERIMANKPI